MKKVLIPIILTVFLLTLVSAINFEMKDTFDQEEALTARLSGDFIDPPLIQNIFFYRGHVRIAISPSIAKIDEDYYLFAPLSGKTANNYSIVIEEVSYKKGSKTIEEDLVKNFTVTQETVDFTIDKGFVDTKDNFYIASGEMESIAIELEQKENEMLEYREEYFSIYSDYVVDVESRLRELGLDSLPDDWTREFDRVRADIPEVESIKGIVDTVKTQFR